MRRFASIGAAVVLVATLMVGGAVPAGAVYPANNTFQAFWEFNLFGAGLASFFDCVEFTNNRICSVLMGKCGSFAVTGTPTDSTSTWEGTIGNSFFLSGGRATLVGVSERRGEGGTVNASMYFKAKGFTRGNGALDAHEDQGFFCDFQTIPGNGPTDSLAGAFQRGDHGKDTTVPGR